MSPMVETVKSNKRSTSVRTVKPAVKSAKKESTKQVSVLRADCFRVLSEDNIADGKKEPKLSKEVLRKMYRNMALTRAYDERGMMLQRQGRGEARTEISFGVCGSVDRAEITGRSRRQSEPKECHTTQQPSLHSKSIQVFCSWVSWVDHGRAFNR